ncbi:MAG: alpha/beta fold hydrolase [Burkholderiales bacterium]|nr:alpha/beta fold hydrolase [Burkholderiales bacterium]
MNKLLLPKNARQFFISGPVGQLDCLELVVPEREATGLAIIFHPNPEGGGTYTNKVVQTIAKGLNSKGYICICPNLRGVGLSDGVHDYGNSEIEDALAIYTYASNKYPQSKIILAGFSFGTFILSKLAAIVKYYKLIMVGPAITKYPFTSIDPENTLVIHGANDEIIPIASVLDWCHQNNQTLIWVPQCGHFFHGKLAKLHAILNTFQLD